MASTTHYTYLQAGFNIGAISEAAMDNLIDFADFDGDGKLVS